MSASSVLRGAGSIACAALIALPAGRAGIATAAPVVETTPTTTVSTFSRETLENLPIRPFGGFLSGLSVVDATIPGTDPADRGFDAAVDAGLQFTPKPAVTAGFALQGGTGSYVPGFASSTFQVSDLFLGLRPGVGDATVVLGKLPLPFGATWNYTDHTTIQRPLVINSYPQSILAQSAVGLRRTVGADLTGKAGGIGYDLYLVNGTGQDASNDDNKFGFGGRLRLGSGFADIDEIDVITGPSAAEYGRTGLGGVLSVIYSDDNSDDGTSGYRAKYFGVQGDGRYTFPRCFGSFIEAMAGYHSFGDDNDATDDGVFGWSAGGTWMRNKFSAGGRISGWYPADDDGSNTGYSPYLPSPGLGFGVPRDQKVHRFQIGVGYKMCTTVDFNLEGTLDRYGEGYSAGPNDDFSVRGFRFSTGFQF